MSRPAGLAALALLLSAGSTLALAGEPDRARIAVVELPSDAIPGGTTMAVVEVSNAGDREWPASGPVRLAYHWLDESGRLVERDGVRTALPQAVAPGTTVRQCAQLVADSPLIERDMTRCVLCGRCVRICGELQGRDELEFIHRGHKTVVGTDGGRALECDFCGFCVSTCPVGGLNDKLFKDRTRVWKLQKETTVCSHCGLGCWTDVHLEKGHLRRVTPTDLAGGKKGLICVRGQFGWRAFQSPSRLSAPRLRRNGVLQEAGWGEAIADTRRPSTGSGAPKAHHPLPCSRRTISRRRTPGGIGYQLWR